MVTLSRANIFSITSLPSITTAADHHHHPHRSFVLSLNKPSPTAYPSFSLRCTPAPSSSLISCNYYWDGGGIRGVFFGAKGTNPNPTSLPSRSSPSISIYAQMSTGIGIGKAQRWWEKGIQPNMKQVTGAQDLVDSLLNAGDKLAVVDFFSPGCGGCKALHPKICQLAEMHADVQFLQVNYEKHKSMCYALNVHVLPFFRFYRGAHGRLCSFSCTNATIKKFKDALAKYGADFCSLEPTKGLEEKELLALAANRDLSFDYTPKPTPPVVVSERDKILLDAEHPLVHIDPLPSTRVSHSEPNPEKRTTLISSGR